MIKHKQIVTVARKIQAVEGCTFRQGKLRAVELFAALYKPTEEKEN